MSQILLSPAPRADQSTQQHADRSVPCRNVRLQADRIDASGRLRASAADLSAEDSRAGNGAGDTADGSGAGGSGRVAKELVHLSFDDAVYLTGCEQQDATHYTVSAVWPAHTAHRIPGHGTHYETLTVAQTIRQAGLFLAHTAYAAPLDHATLLRTFSYTLNPDAAVDTHRATPLHVNITATPTTRNKRTTALHLHMTVTAAGSGDAGDEASETVLATGETDFEWIPPMVYRRLRGAYHRPPTTLPPVTPPLPPVQVGRTTPDEVVLSPTAQPRTWQLRHTFDNTVLYDHAVDHVPGLVLIEAANQGAYTVTAPVTEAVTAGTDAATDVDPCACAPDAAGTGYRPQPTATHTTFHRYAEFDAPITLTTETRTTSHTVTHTTVGLQNDQPVFTTTHTAPAPVA
ncbi:ScbA/BarX family gamma-butyrolactone biosynthesis protein [Streptomyces roseifaciens]|uniref:ScbA/BarX family gamma-butyrolactone biosynthesis protein n=1 Tax=Streptomyces roseifaciens TaxID=1488406 RepID=UPI000718038A|nr:ScbA/BarX family gamma-butyrolactone biosynthesis protein [Streptomyces roseifaciens]